MASCRRHIAGRTAAVAAALMIAACSSINPFSDDAPESTANQPVTQPSVTSAENAAAAGSPANPFMWQAALEHVGFMPLQKVDDLQGEIVTDWYVPPGAPLERFRLDVVFSSRALRAESLAIDVQRQELRESGNWYDAPASPSVSSNLLDSILARALVLRQESGTL